MKKVVVTGANGFIGSNLIDGLLQKGYIVYAVVRNAQSDVSRIPQNENVFLIYCELQKIDALLDQLQDESMDYFFHLAWEGSAGNSRGDYELQLNNVKYTCDAVKVAAKLNCKKFIFAGSIMEYEAKQYMVQEDALPGRGYYYSVAKLTADYMAKIEAVNSKVQYNNCLISNIYGAGEIAERFINTTIRKMMRKEQLLFSAGEQYYDFIYVSDAVRAMILVAEKGTANKEYYIGNSRVCKLKEYIILMRDIIDPTAVLQLGALDYRGPFLDYNQIGIDKLNKELGFRPEITFEKGIQMTKRWIEDSSEVYKLDEGKG